MIKVASEQGSQGDSASCTPPGGAVHTLVCGNRDPGIPLCLTCVVTVDSPAPENLAS